MERWVVWPWWACEETSPGGLSQYLWLSSKALRFPNFPFWAPPLSSCPSLTASTKGHKVPAELRLRECPETPRSITCLASCRLHMAGQRCCLLYGRVFPRLTPNGRLVCPKCMDPEWQHTHTFAHTSLLCHTLTSTQAHTHTHMHSYAP